MSHLTIVCGPTKAGKTFWTMRAIANARRLIVVDPIGEYDVGGVAYGTDECLDRIVQLCEARVPRFRIACRLPKDEADEVVRAVWGFQTSYDKPDPRRMITLVVDEADRISKPGDRDSGMDIMINQGRRVADPCFFLTRRLARLSVDARANAGRFVMFGFDEPADVDAFRKRKGDDAVAKVMALRKFECAIF